LFYFQIASLFTYMTTRMNEWTTTHTTAAASSIDVRVSDLDLFYFWFIQFVCDYSSLFYSHHVLFWLFFFAKAYLLMYFLIFFFTGVDLNWETQLDAKHTENGIQIRREP
jgi:hypothetical protein